jgi:hypothetical protein
MRTCWRKLARDTTRPARGLLCVPSRSADSIVVGAADATFRVKRTGGPNVKTFYRCALRRCPAPMPALTRWRRPGVITNVLVVLTPTGRSVDGVDVVLVLTRSTQDSLARPVHR